MSLPHHTIYWTLFILFGIYYINYNNIFMYVTKCLLTVVARMLNIKILASFIRHLDKYV